MNVNFVVLQFYIEHTFGVVINYKVLKQCHQ